MTRTRCAGLALISFALLMAASPGARGEDQELKVPDVPQLDIGVDDDGLTTVSRHGETHALDEEALAGLLDNHAAFRDEGTWAGRAAATGISENPVVMHVEAMSDAREIGKVYKAMAAHKLYRSAVGITEYIDDPLFPPNAPDLDDLPDGYLKLEMPRDEGLSSAPPVPKVRVAVYPHWSEEDGGGSFVIAIDAQGHNPVEKSWTTREQLESEAAEHRKDVIERIKEAMSDNIARSGAHIEICDITFDRGEDSKPTPWAMIDMSYRAALALNAEREEAGKEALEVYSRWTTPPVEPPPPEMPPEKPVEFPKDEESNGEDKEEPKGGDWDDTGDTGKVKTSGMMAWRKEQQPTHPERVKAALQWLVDHQNDEGFWDPTTFDDDSTRKGATVTRNLEFVKPGDAAGDDGWRSNTRAGLTGLAILAFTAGGHTHQDGPYRRTIRSAVVYLRKVQDNDGCFGDKSDDIFVYNHAIAASAFAELYGLSGDAVLKPMADRAVEFILKAQNPGLGWRYGVQPGINDSSVTGWMVYALAVANDCGLEFDSTKSFADAAAWYELVTIDVEGSPQVGYDSPGSENARLRSAREYDTNPTLDAIYSFSMLAMGRADMEDETTQALIAKCAESETLPTWEHHKIDFYYWFWGSLATFQAGGEPWKKWEKAMAGTLKDFQRGWHKTDVENEHTSAEILDEHGSWDPVGAWGSAGGRVYSTAMGALILQTSSRYQRFDEE